MNSVVNTDGLRAAFNACLPKLSEFGTEVGQNEQLYQAYQQIRDAAVFAELSHAQRKTVEDALRDFRLAGVSLPEEQKQRYKEISSRLSELRSTFEEHVMDATDGWSKLITDEQDLAGVPETAKANFRQNAERKGESGWLVNLDFPSYYPLLTYADNRTLREEIYHAYTTRASDIGPNGGKWNNLPLMEEILKLRHEQAQLLGFANYAERSLATKMAGS